MPESKGDLTDVIVLAYVVLSFVLLGWLVYWAVNASESNLRERVELLQSRVRVLQAEKANCH